MSDQPGAPHAKSSTAAETGISPNPLPATYSSILTGDRLLTHTTPPPPLARFGWCCQYIPPDGGSMSKLGRCSDRHGESWDLVVVGSHGRIPSGEQVAQCAVESFGSGLQEPVGALLRPLHLLFLGEASADHEVDSGLSERGGDPLAVEPAFAVVRESCSIVGDVGGQVGGRLDQPLQLGIATVQGGNIRSELLGPGQRLAGVAVPEPPFDPLQPALQRSSLDGVVVR